MNFEAIEEKFSLPLPDAYKKCVENGILEKLDALDFDFMPIEIDDIAEQHGDLMEFNFDSDINCGTLVGDLDPDTSYVILKGDKFIPFARTEQGDFICFYRSANTESTDIIYAPNDQDGFEFLAPDFATFLYLHVLKMMGFEYICEEDDAADDLMEFNKLLTGIIGAELQADLEARIQRGKNDEDLFVNEADLEQRVEELGLSGFVGKETYKYE